MMIPASDKSCGCVKHNDDGYPRYALVDENEGEFLGWATEGDTVRYLASDQTQSFIKNGARCYLGVVTWHDQSCNEDCPFGQDGYSSEAIDVHDIEAIAHLCDVVAVLVGIASR